MLYTTVHDALKNEIVTKRCVDEFLFRSQDPFSQQLAITAYQYWGRIPSAHF